MDEQEVVERDVSNANLAREGRLTLAQGGGFFQFTHSNVPDAAGYSAYQDEIARRSIILDDNITKQNPDPIIYPSPELSATAVHDAEHGLRMIQDID